MAIKDQVQGVVQALFGAYAGGYLAELTAEATGGSVGATAARLASIQGVVLGQDLKSNATFVDIFLSNLGVTSTNAAYIAAAKWANDALTAGATRGDVVTAAVTFLEGVAAGTIADANYVTVAKAYAAKVAAGVTYSESTIGSKVLSLADLQEEAGVASSVNLTTALAKLSADTAAVAAYIKAFAAANKDVVATAGADESTVAGFNTTAVSKFTTDATVVASGATLTTGSTAAQAELAFSIARLSVSNTISAKQAEITADNAAIDGVAGLRAAITAYDAKVATAKTAETAKDAAEAALGAAVGSFNVTEGAPVAIALADFTISADVNGNVTVANDAADYLEIATNNADGTLDVLTLKAGVTETTAPGVTALMTAANAYAAKVFADNKADAAVTAAFAAGVLGTNQAKYTDLAVDTAALADAQEASADLETVIASTKVARGYAAELKALNDAITNAKETGSADVIAASGYDLNAAGYDFAGTTTDLVIGAQADEKEVYTAAANSTVAFGSFKADDVISLVGFKYNAGKIATAGDDAVKEFFVSETGGTTTVTFENVAYGSNSAAGGVEAETTIVLTGVAMADLVIGANYITLA